MGELVGDRSVRDFIERHAAAHPEAPFLIAPEAQSQIAPEAGSQIAPEAQSPPSQIAPEARGHITWAGLSQAAADFSDALSVLGIGPGEPVSTMMGNGWNAALAILGTLYGGRLTAPVNLAAGDPQIAYTLEHSGTGIVLVSPEEEARLHRILEQVDRPVRVIRCGERGPEWPEAASLPAPAPEGPDRHDNRIDGLLMYTSGTTGRPKGTVLAQRAILAGGENAIIAHGLTPEDRTLLVLPLYHINGFCVSLMSTLVSGASMVAPPRFSVSRFWEQVIAERCTWFSAVPTQYQYLLRAAEADGPPPRGELAHVRFARSASAPLSPEVHRAFEDLFGMVLIETMGLTETAAQITSNPIPPGERKYGSPGKAYGNEVAILDKENREVPRGTEGEIAVRGENVFRCYLKNAEATAESFTPAGWFLTGDLGRMDAEGYIYVTGQGADHQGRREHRAPRDRRGAPDPPASGRGRRLRRRRRELRPAGRGGRFPDRRRQRHRGRADRAGPRPGRPLQGARPRAHPRGSAEGPLGQGAAAEARRDGRARRIRLK